MNRRIGHEATDRLLARAGAGAAVLSAARQGRADRAPERRRFRAVPAGGRHRRRNRTLAAGGACAPRWPRWTRGRARRRRRRAAASRAAPARAPVAGRWRAGAGRDRRRLCACRVAPAAPADAPVRGEREWHARLAAGAAAAAARGWREFEVRDASGDLLHLDCPMRLQLRAGRAFRAGRALAGDGRALPPGGAGRPGRRSTLALAAIGRDGRPRCVNVAAASLASRGLHRRGAAAAAGGARGRGQAVDRRGRRRRAAAAAAARGQRAAGGRWACASAWSMPARACASCRACTRWAWTTSRSTAPSCRAWPRGRRCASWRAAWSRCCAAWSVQILAEGVDDAADLAALWALGFDGATGAGAAARRAAERRLQPMSATCSSKRPALRSAK